MSLAELLKFFDFRGMVEVTNRNLLKFEKLLVSETFLQWGGKDIRWAVVEIFFCCVFTSSIG